MKQTGKRVLSILCTLTMLLSLMAMIVPGASAATNEIDAIPSEHLASVRDYSCFATQEGMTAHVDDAEAYGGKAACYSTPLDDANFLGIYRYDVASGLPDQDLRIGQMMLKDLKVNQGCIELWSDSNELRIFRK